MSKFPICTFCGKNDAKPSKEHIIPKWMSREFPDSTWELTNRLTKYVRKSTKYVHLIARYPCMNCNSGWMSDLEQLASPILIPLMHGQPATLSVHDQVTIRTWFFMKTVMFDLHSAVEKLHPRHPEAKKPRPRYFENEELASLKSTLSVHPAYMVFIGRYKNKGRGIYQEDHSGVSVADANDLEPLSDPVRGYAFTFTIEHLVLQSFCAKIDPNLPFYLRDFRLFYAEIGRSSDAVRWPPPREFNDPLLDKFVYRWSEERPLPNS